MRIGYTLLPAFLLTAVLLVASAACGSTREEGAGTPLGGPSVSVPGFDPGSAEQKVEIIAGPGSPQLLRWDQGVYTANAGDVTFVMTNASQTQHQFTVRGNGVLARSGEFNPGFIGQYTPRNLQPGEHEIACRFHDHAGMVSKLVIK